MYYRHDTMDNNFDLHTDIMPKYAAAHCIKNTQEQKLF